MPSWDQLSVSKAHYAYLILGGFTSLFMLCSLFVKEKLYIGEATVATLCGVVFGPHAANLFNPASWGNVDSITLECSRIVLVVQCFAVGVELPKSYMERHWRSVTFLLVPVMTYGWLVTSLFIWWMIEPLTWLESLMCAACVTATDPVLASSVVGKGKFAKRVPKHLRDVLSAESGCNDGMAFPFIYLSYYLIHYRPDAAKVTQHWICNTILYECLWGAVYGFLLGYAGRHAIKWADRKNLIDRESFLVFYFVLALFCAGTGSTLGMDDLLVGFSAGVGFSNDGWFTQKTEEAHVSNVIDLLLNLAYFVYLGSVIPWAEFNNPLIGLTPWRLVVISLLVIFFRRIPIMMALKPIIPDVKTWREALFAGHFGPIGVGAIFAALLARAELETDTTEPLPIEEFPTDTHAHNYVVINVIWPITCFLVITSILVHGSSIAVFTLGKRINQFTLTMSYTQQNEEGPSWMNRLPRIASTARSSMSKGRDDDSPDESDEKLPEYPPNTLPPIGLPGNFLRRQTEEETALEGPRNRRKSKWESGRGPGGPISQSAIAPQRRAENLPQEESNSDTLNEKDVSPSSSVEQEPPDQLEMEDAQEKRDAKYGKQDRDEKLRHEPELEVYQEDDNLVVEDEEGNVVNVHNIKGRTDEETREFIKQDEKKVREDRTGEFAKGKYHPHEKNEGEDLEKQTGEALGHPEHGWKKVSNIFGAWNGFKRPNRPTEDKPPMAPAEEKKNQAAHAYQFGQTLIVEDEDGEVIKKIDLGPKSTSRGGLRGGVQDGPHHFDSAPIRQGLRRMSTWAGMAPTSKGEQPAPEQGAEAEASAKPPKKKPAGDDADDDRLRFTVGASGRRMSKQEFIEQLQQLDPKARRQMVESSDAPREVKDEVHVDAIQEQETGATAFRRPSYGKASQQQQPPLSPLEEGDGAEDEMAHIKRVETRASNPPSANPSVEDIPSHDVGRSVLKRTLGEETAAQRRRRLAAEGKDDSDDEGPPPTSRRQKKKKEAEEGYHGESAAERRRRLAALGEGAESSDSEDDGGERQPQGKKVVQEPSRIRFADSPAVSQGRVQWGEGVSETKPGLGVFGRKGKR